MSCSIFFLNLSLIYTGVYIYIVLQHWSTNGAPLSLLGGLIYLLGELATSSTQHTLHQLIVCVINVQDLIC